LPMEFSIPDGTCSPPDKLSIDVLKGEPHLDVNHAARETHPRTYRKGLVMFVMFVLSLCYAESPDPATMGITPHRYRAELVVRKSTSAVVKD